MMGLNFGVHLPDFFIPWLPADQQVELFERNFFRINHSHRISQSSGRTDCDFVHCSSDLQVSFGIVAPWRFRSVGATITAVVENTISDRLV